jgi:hypothetical protein
LLANYTYGRTIDEQSTLSTTSSTPLPEHIGTQYAPSDQNTTQIFNMGWHLNLPMWSTSSAALKAVFGDWGFNGIYNARTGHPFNITIGGDEIGTDEPQQRAYLIPGMSPTLPSSRHRIDKIAAWFNSTAFKKPDLKTVGNIGRNSMVGPAYINTQFSLTKNIVLNRFRQGMHAQLRAEAFNVFNTVNLGQPQASYTTSTTNATTFGSINSPGQNPNRRMQFGLLIYF